ncbi:hypothetical protein BDY21DRAFT_195337 [Lineolata rhizophorae]|uniref:Uncharacterized protein n=1 Tax=Lineolata rhizophorae TaxID=578093 RepID=A0A6A6P6R4_9PEZI|nr:hypothetical protein BDY21DRAFT_195337 [Lineolata rhizophorae]
MMKGVKCLVDFFFFVLLLMDSCFVVALCFLFVARSAPRIVSPALNNSLAFSGKTQPRDETQVVLTPRAESNAPQSRTQRAHRR